MLAPPHSLHWLLRRWCWQTLRGSFFAGPPADLASPRSQNSFVIGTAVINTHILRLPVSPPAGSAGATHPSQEPPAGPAPSASVRMASSTLDSEGMMQLPPPSSCSCTDRAWCSIMLSESCAATRQRTRAHQQLGERGQDAAANPFKLQLRLCLRMVQHHAVRVVLAHAATRHRTCGGICNCSTAS